MECATIRDSLEHSIGFALCRIVHVGVIQQILNPKENLRFAHERPDEDR